MLHRSKEPSSVSVAFRYFHPDDLIIGEGTREHGGRFVPVGVRAVYASAEEDTALREVTQRRTTLGGERQIDVGEYPRMIYLLAISTQRNLDLTHSLDPQLEHEVERCLAARLVYTCDADDEIRRSSSQAGLVQTAGFGCTLSTRLYECGPFAEIPEMWQIVESANC